MTKIMDEKPKQTYLKACSQWVQEFAKHLDAYQMNKSILNRNINNFINISNRYPKDPVEYVTISMMKTNNTVVKFFKEKGLDLDSEIDLIFRKNNTIVDFSKDLKKFVQDVIEPKVLSNTSQLSSMQTKLNHYDKINRIYNTGIIDFSFVKDKLDSKVDYWKVKEAVSWMVGFVEYCDYNLNDIFILNKNGYIDKDKSFENLLEKINEASLTQKNPFKILNKNIYFNDAKGGEVDVMLWQAKTHEIVAMSATRDRGYKIEGNQFPRHLMKALLMQDNIIRLFQQNNANPSIVKNVQTVVRNEQFKTFNPTVSQLSTLTQDPDVISELYSLNSFAKELSTVREKIKKMTTIDFHSNGTTINEHEMDSLLAYSANKVKFVFYGELLEYKDQPLMQAGLNCLAYRDNFKRFGKFRLNDNATNLFLRNIDKRFNCINASEDSLEVYGQDFISFLIKNCNNESNVVSKLQYFAESNVYNEERSCLFKATNVLFKNIINEINKSIYLIDKNIIKNVDEKIIDKSIEKGIKIFFDQGIDKNNIKELVFFFKNKKLINQFLKNYNNIKTSVSEVPLELDELENSADKLHILLENIDLKIQIKELQKMKNKSTVNSKNNKLLKNI